MLLLLFLGYSSGLPLKLVFATLSLWLIEEGIDKSTVGTFALVSLPYSLKILWAPFIDQTRLPVLDAWLGHRRAWMLVTQVGLVFAILAMSLTDPFAAPSATAAAALVVALLSASQDVVVDAYRVELLEPEEQGAGTAIFVLGYRLAMLTAGAGALHLVTDFEASMWLATLRHGLHGDPAMYAWASARDGWSLAYAVMALLMGVGIVATLAAREPGGREVDSAQDRRPFRQIVRDAIVVPFAQFAARRGWWLILIFVFTFKLSDALAAVMTGPFLLETGFTRSEIAHVRDTWGLVASLSGVALGGVLVRAIGVTRSLRVAIAVMIVSNGMFSIQALVGHDVRVLVATIGIENVTGGFGTAAFVAYLSGLCDRRLAATQYALLTSISALSGTLLGSRAGWLALEVGWPAFFLVTAAASLPALAVDALRRYVDDSPPPPSIAP